MTIIVWKIFNKIPVFAPIATDAATGVTIVAGAATGIGLLRNATTIMVNTLITAMTAKQINTNIA